MPEYLAKTALGPVARDGAADRGDRGDNGDPARAAGRFQGWAGAPPEREGTAVQAAALLANGPDIALAAKVLLGA